MLKRVDRVSVKDNLGAQMMSECLGGAAYRCRPDAALHLQRVPAHGARQGGDAHQRPGSTQGRLLEQIRPVPQSLHLQWLHNRF